MWGTNYVLPLYYIQFRGKLRPFVANDMVANDMVFPAPNVPLGTACLGMGCILMELIKDPIKVCECRFVSFLSND